MSQQFKKAPVHLFFLLVSIEGFWKQIFHLCTKGNSGMQPPSSCLSFAINSVAKETEGWCHHWYQAHYGQSCNYNSPLHNGFVCWSQLFGVGGTRGSFYESGGGGWCHQTRPGTAAQLKAPASRLPFDVTHHTLWCNTSQSILANTLHRYR